MESLMLFFDMQVVTVLTLCLDSVCEVIEDLIRMTRRDTTTK